jgi:hypothetical protein
MALSPKAKTHPTKNKIFVSVNLNSGLGNQLFQLGFLHFIALLYNAKPFLLQSNTPKTQHTDKNYFDSIFKHFRSLYSPKEGAYTVRENSEQRVENWNLRLEEFKNESILNFTGYFQQWVYMDAIRSSFISFLDFSAQEHLLEKYNVANKVFVHIRGGDFLEQRHRHHFLDLRKYYKTCESFHPEDEFVIFTNDESYARQFLLENNLFARSSFIIEDELGSLYLMSKCKACICANSTFSWWGAYLDTSRKIYLPSQYYTNGHPRYQDQYFPGSIKIDV